MNRRTTYETIIKFNTPYDLKNELIALAESRNITLSALIRLALSEYVKHKKQSG